MRYEGLEIGFLPVTRQRVHRRSRGVVAALMTLDHRDEVTRDEHDLEIQRPRYVLDGQRQRPDSDASGTL